VCAPYHQAILCLNNQLITSLVPCSLANLNESILINILWPFVPDFTKETRGTDEDLGFYVGMLASSFFIAQLVASIFWGWAADVFGRRPVILLGLSGSIFAVMIFGFAKSYWVGMLSRVASGLLNGNVVATKAMMSELLPGKLRAQGFSLLGFNWGLGSVIGPLVGSFLAHPAEQFGLDSPFLKEFPYFLPCLFSAFISFMGISVGYFRLQEGAAFTPADDWREAVPNSVKCCLVRCGVIEGASQPSAFPQAQKAPSSRKQGEAETQAEIELEGMEGGEASAANPSSSRGLYAPVSGAGGLPRIAGTAEDDEGLLPSEHGEAANALDDGSNPSKAADSRGASAARASAISGPRAANDAEMQAEDEAEEVDPLKTRETMTAISMYGAVALSIILFDEMLPIFSQLPEAQGGLGQTRQGVGSLLAMQGAMLLVYQLIVFPFVSSWLGVRRLYLVASGVGVPLFAAFPILPYVERALEHGYASWVVWVVAYFPYFLMKSMVNASLFSCVFTLINSAAK